MKKTIALIAALDTKGYEAGYIRDSICSLGKSVIVVDCGIRGEPQGIKADIPREAVAEHSGYNLEFIQQAESRGAASALMAQGVASLLNHLFVTGAVDGVICIGGAGVTVGAMGMQNLPVGFPKLLVSPMFSGERVFEPFVGTSDMTMMHSVVDILGLNEISRAVLGSAAGAIAGMVESSRPIDMSRGRLIGATMFGVTTPGVMAARSVLEKAGYECVVFHANGAGGRCMEALARARVFAGILDYTLSEIAGAELGELNDAGPERMEIAGRYGIPQVIVPGCLDFLDVPPMHIERLGYGSRQMCSHTPEFLLVRIVKEEMIRLGNTLARKLNLSKGPTEVVWPTLGLSTPNTQGGPLWDPEADRACLEALKKRLKASIPVREVEAHINDPGFAEYAAARLLALIQGNSNRGGFQPGP